MSRGRQACRQGDSALNEILHKDQDSGNYPGFLLLSLLKEVVKYPYIT